MNDGEKWESFDALVAWATWEVIQGLTKGEPLRALLHRVLSVTRHATFQ